MSTISTSEQEARVTYCKDKKVHHLFEVMATRVLLDKPQDIFGYLRDLLTNIEDSEKKEKHDPSKIPDASGGKLIKITLAIFGLDNAGKTSLLSAMGGQIDTETQPTVGFTPIQFQTDKYDICIFDLGGAKNFRGIWQHYFHDCHGMIYVVDASDSSRLAESAAVFKDVVTHKYMQKKPVLVFANKKDKVSHGKQPESIVTDALQVESVMPTGTERKILPTCGIQEDTVLESGVEWILGTVAKNYAVLSKRVTEDTEAIKEEKKRKQQERLEALRKQNEGQ